MHSPAGQHHPFLIPPARERRGESSAPAPSPHPRPGSGCAPGAARVHPWPRPRTRAPRDGEERLGQPGGAFGRPRQRGRWETRTKEKQEAATPGDRGGGSAAAPGSARGATGARGWGLPAAGQRDQGHRCPAEAPLPAPGTPGCPPRPAVPSGGLSPPQQPAKGTGSARTAGTAPPGRERRRGKQPLQGAVLGCAGEEESGCPAPRWPQGEGRRAQTAPAGWTGAGGGHGGEARRAPGSRCMRAGTAARAPAEERTKLARLSRRTAPVVRPGGGTRRCPSPGRGGRCGGGERVAAGAVLQAAEVSARYSPAAPR